MGTAIGPVEMAATPPSIGAVDFGALRLQMVERQLVARGIRDRLVVRAMLRVPREEFVPLALRHLAYEDTPLPIAEGQTISQPYIVAVMVEALRLTGGERVLDIGTGSGYSAAVLGEIAGEVYTVERHEALADSARSRLRQLGYDRVQVLHGDGTRGWPAAAPYQGIVVAAGGPSLPPTLLEQLADGGRLVIPIGRDARSQELIRVQRKGTHDSYEHLGAVRFVPLVGQQGWTDEVADVAADAPLEA